MNYHKYMKLRIIAKIVSVILIISFVSCSKNSSTNSNINGAYYSKTTGWKYNVRRNTGWKYDKRAADAYGLGNSFKTEAPIGMVAIPGGSYVIGERNDYLTSQYNSKRRRITVSPFYMDQYEIRNIDWHEYVNWVKTVYVNVAPELVDRVRPHIKGEELSFNDPFLSNYLTHPVFNNYPVVGVTWEQAVDYCAWRTDRVNELALIKNGQLTWPDYKNIRKQINADSIAYNYVFSTQKYLIQETYIPPFGKKPIKDFDGNPRKANLDDGIMLADYRLPTEAEWEYAAYGISSDEGNVNRKGAYPWTGKKSEKKRKGSANSNYIRGRGDLYGNPGRYNDRPNFTVPVGANKPNEFGLYNMAGNVNEWVLDVYRTLTFQDAPDNNPFRGNVYRTPIIEGTSETGQRLYKVDKFGRIATEVKKGDDLRNFKDGDAESQLQISLANPGLVRRDTLDITDILRPEINDKARVYKGGSWKDRAYWLNPSTRRYLEQDKSSSDIGFRCAMSMVGNSIKSKSK